MSEATSTTNSGAAGRMIALAVAALAAWGLYVTYQKTQTIRTQASDPALSAETLPAFGQNEAVAQCIEQRVAEVEYMVENGFLAKDVADRSKDEARSICISEVSGRLQPGPDVGL